MGYMVGDFLTNSSGANFSYIFFRGKSLFAELLGKTIFQNFFRRKLQFFPTFLGGKFSLEKMYEKSAPGYPGGCNFLENVVEVREDGKLSKIKI
jgi:hypothetical protein